MLPRVDEQLPWPKLRIASPGRLSLVGHRLAAGWIRVPNYVLPTMHSRSACGLPPQAGHETDLFPAEAICPLPFAPLWCLLPGVGL